MNGVAIIHRKLSHGGFAAGDAPISPGSAHLNHGDGLAGLRQRKRKTLRSGERSGKCSEQ